MKRSGDGSGIMTALPWDLLEREFAKIGVDVGALPPRDHRAVGMVFLPQAAEEAATCRATVEKMLIEAGLDFHGWRQVPVDPMCLGPQSRENQPTIEQVCVCACGWNVVSCSGVGESSRSGGDVVLHCRRHLYSFDNPTKGHAIPRRDAKRDTWSPVAPHAIVRTRETGVMSCQQLCVDCTTHGFIAISLINAGTGDTNFVNKE